ncbi:RidA family protein [Bradyrhizobium sp. 83012]|uniref:RidA family protein n=1 Tax=Bradyrhizobium aeschynomenes TaxID=2734909 RepID=A0ABX2CDB6_9BRAD|nr:RidA family protein [Bradyrhizobium aeschynomenes]NPU65818.1 RidA family protein [Bradyrhizobium aeschynomenes]
MTITRKIRSAIHHRIVEANGFVFIGGTIADDTSVSMGEQTRNILGKIDGFLKEAGTDRSRVVSGQIFVTDLSKKKEMDAAWIEFFGEDLPVRATVGISDLGGGALIEIVITAVKG